MGGLGSGDCLLDSRKIQEVSQQASNMAWHFLLGLSKSLLRDIISDCIYLN